MNNTTLKLRTTCINKIILSILGFAALNLTKPSFSMNFCSNEEEEKQFESELIAEIEKEQEKLGLFDLMNPAQQKKYIEGVFSGKLENRNSDNNIFDAIRSGNLKEVKRLIEEEKINVNSRDLKTPGGDSPLEYALDIAIYNSEIAEAYEILSLILSKCTEKTINIPNRYGSTQLNNACSSYSSNNIKIAKLLLEKSTKESINKIDNLGENPLCKAFYKARFETKYFELVELLINKGATLDNTCLYFENKIKELFAEKSKSLLRHYLHSHTELFFTVRNYTINKINEHLKRQKELVNLNKENIAWINSISKKREINENKINAIKQEDDSLPKPDKPSFEFSAEDEANARGIQAKREELAKEIEELEYANKILDEKTKQLDDELLMEFIEINENIKVKKTKLIKDFEIVDRVQKELATSGLIPSSDYASLYGDRI